MSADFETGDWLNPGINTVLKASRRLAKRALRLDRRPRPVQSQYRAPHLAGIMRLRMVVVTYI